MNQRTEMPKVLIHSCELSGVLRLWGAAACLFVGSMLGLGADLFGQDSPATKPVAKETATDKSTEAKDDDDEVEMNDREKAFAKLMTNAKLLGNFTVDGQDLGKLTAEEYTIESAKKLGMGDQWGFMARIKYADKDYRVPLVLSVIWADDTPMITLTDFTILGQGPFSSRVIFYDNKYVGTWSHGKVGGHLFGRISHEEPKIEKAESKEKSDKDQSKK
jgi:hypothetical protein